MSEEKKKALQSLAIGAAIGFALYKFTGNALLKAAGAGVLGVNAVDAVRTIANI